MKKLFMILALAGSILIAGTMFTSCRGKASAGKASAGKAADSKTSIVGVWVYPDLGYAYTFNADGTGSYGVGEDASMPFTYTDDGKSVEIRYEGTTDGNKYDYSIAGEKLTIKDDFGSDVVYEKKK